MKLLKLLLVFGLLCKTIAAHEDTSLSLEAIWQSTRQLSCPSEDAPWKAGVQEFYTGCRTAADTFRGNAFEIADTTLNTLQTLLTKLIDFVDTNSTIVASSSVNVLQSLSKCNKLGLSGSHIITEYVKVFPNVVQTFDDVASNLSEHIGCDLTNSYTDAVSDLGAELTKFMKEFVQTYRLFKCKETIDYKSVLQKYQNLTNLLALIDNTLLNESEDDATKEVYDSVFVLHLLYIYMGISVTGINSCALDALYKRNCYVSESVKSCVLSFEDALVEVLQAVCAVVVSSVNSIKNLLKTVVNIVAFLNTVIKDVLGVSTGVLLTVGDIVQNLATGNKVAAPATKGPGSILNGIL